MTSLNIKHFTFASKAANNNHFRNDQQQQPEFEGLVESSHERLPWITKAVTPEHKSTQRNHRRDESLEPGGIVGLTGALPTPTRFWEIRQKPINQKKEWHELVCVCVCVCVCAYCMRRVNKTMAHNHIYTCQVSLLYFLAECNVIYWTIIYAMHRLNLTASFVNKNHLLVILSVYYKTPKLKYVNVKSNIIQAETFMLYPTFYSTQLVAHHLLRHKGRHVGFVATCCWCWLLVGTP
jgi:hypothetical protein